MVKNHTKTTKMSHFTTLRTIVFVIGTKFLKKIQNLIFRLLEFWIFGFLMFWIFGNLDFWNSGFLKFSVFGILEFKILEYLEFWIFGMDFRGIRVRFWRNVARFARKCCKMGLFAWFSTTVICIRLHSSCSKLSKLKKY